MSVIVKLHTAAGEVETVIVKLHTAEVKAAVCTA